MLNSAKQILAKIASKHGADYLEKIPVVTGNRARVVDAGDGKIWVRFSTGLEARVINTLAPLAPDRHITIGRLRSAPNVWRVAEIREVYIESDSRQFMPHHLQHEFSGFDQVNINRKQIISATAFVSDSENFLVRVYGGLFQTDSGWVLAQSTDGTPAHPDLDLSAEVPTSGAVYVGIESDDTGALSLNVGTPFAAPELATGADVPIPPDGSRLIAFVLLYDSQVELLDSDISVPGLFASAPGSATGGGHVIEDEGAPLTQRTKLNFVGGGITATDDSGDDASVVTVDEQTIGDLIEGSTNKATPVDADRFGFWDSVADILKYATWENIKSVLKTYFDTLYQNILTAANIGDFIVGLSSKTTPIDADSILLSDSAASDDGKKVSWANVKATLKTYLDTLYQPVDSDLTAIAGLSPSNDDVIQRKAGAWVNRTLAQLLADFPIAFGTYTPALTNGTNIAASGLNQDFFYIRVLGFVAGAGSITVDVTTAAVLSDVGISIPIASNFGTSYDAHGNATTPGEYGGSVIADATNDRLQLFIRPISNANLFWRILFAYRII